MEARSRWPFSDARAETGASVVAPRAGRPLARLRIALAPLTDRAESFVGRTDASSTIFVSAMTVPSRTNRCDLGGDTREGWVPNTLDRPMRLSVSGLRVFALPSRREPAESVPRPRRRDPGRDGARSVDPRALRRSTPLGGDQSRDRCLSGWYRDRRVRRARPRQRGDARPAPPGARVWGRHLYCSRPRCTRSAAAS